MDGETPETAPELAEIKVYRNHFVYVLKTVILALFFMFIWVLSMAANEDVGIVRLELIYPIAVIIAAILYIAIRVWLKTTYTFGPTELTVKRDTIFKKDTKIQYSRMASVNVRRSIIDHLFGTTTLMFNINSSVNSQQAEASLILKADEANALREEISKLIFSKAMSIDEDVQQETMVSISNFDVILHGFFGQPTVQSVLGLIFLGYSIFTALTDSGGLFAALIMFGLTSVLPWISTILRHYNYRVYRVGDTITVESGLLSNFRSSFNIKKVNSVRIREPLLARLMGKSVLEAEVIGLADGQGMPLLCPLKGRKTVDALAQKLVPEFLFDTNHLTQPRQSMVPTFFYKIVLALISLAIGAAFYIYVSTNFPPESTVERFFFQITYVTLLVIIPAASLAHGVLAQRNREFEMGDETFMLVTGAFDRQREFIRYDKVQKSVVAAGPIQRLFGVGTITVSMMTSMGARNVSSGIFIKDELEKVPAEVLGRILDGRYDYRKYQ